MHSLTGREALCMSLFVIHSFISVYSEYIEPFLQSRMHFEWADLEEETFCLLGHKIISQNFPKMSHLKPSPVISRLYLIGPTDVSFRYQEWNSWVDSKIVYLSWWLLVPEEARYGLKHHLNLTTFLKRIVFQVRISLSQLKLNVLRSIERTGGSVSIHACVCVCVHI